MKAVRAGELGLEQYQFEKEGSESTEPQQSLSFDSLYGNHDSLYVKEMEERRNTSLSAAMQV